MCENMLESWQILLSFIYKIFDTQNQTRFSVSTLSIVRVEMSE